MSEKQRASDDRALLRRLASGDKEAVGSLYDRYGAGLYAHALWISKRREDAEDAVQAIFVKLVGKGAELLGIRRVRAYLHRMLHHAVQDELRRQARFSPGAAELLLPPQRATAEDLLELRNVLESLETINPEQRETIVLHLYEGFSFREIGSITGVSTFTAASRYRLALRKLQATMTSRSK